MTASPIQVLVGVCGFGVEISFNLAVIEDHLYVKKGNGGRRYRLFEFNVWVETVACIKELLEFCRTKRPEEEDVINESEPY